MADKISMVEGGKMVNGTFVPKEISSITDPSNFSSTSSGSSNADFMTEVQNRLLGQANIVSSSDTALEETFNSAISGLQSAGDKTTQRIESQFGRERGYAEGAAQDSFTDFGESRSGFGTQMVAFRRLVDSTDKQLNDLESRKQELILQGESNLATEIAKLQVQKLQFRQQAEQNVFSNLLGIANFAQQNRSQDLAERNFGLNVKQFELQGIQASMEQSNNAFTRIGQLKQMGALSGMATEELSKLEMQAGLPSGTAQAIANVPPQQEIRAVGDTLVAIDPTTMKARVIYNGGSSGGSGVSIGGQSVSFLTSSVLNGMQRLDDLTTSDASKVRAEMAKLGFGSENPPAWYINKMRQQYIDKMSPGASTPMDSLNSAADAAARTEWGKYQDSFIYGERFLDQNFFGKVFTQDQIKDKAKESGVKPNEYMTQLNGIVESYRAAGFSDKEILKMMQN